MLTDRQAEVYDFIRAYTERHGVAPKLREIARHLGIRSRGSVHRYLRAIADAGLIDIEPQRARGIRPRSNRTEPPRRARRAARPTTLPLLGRIAAGRPIEAIPDQDEIDLSEFFMGPGRFVLRVQGDSMIEAGILDGDMVIVESRERARDGDIVVALIDNEEATLKRIQHHADGSITLRPANAALKPLRMTGGRVRVQGVVVGQFRSYRAPGSR
ncbi:MAG TPA: transcriptional repressor LexA [Acidiferrobacterales bacterium]|jgi:repressor LexA